MNRTTWTIFITLCVVLLGGLIWTSRGASLDVSDVDVWAMTSAETRNGDIAEHIVGNPDAKVRIIEYGDYQCPGCGSAAPVMKSVAEKYKDNVAFVFRNFPLPTLHPNARAAAAAAEAAGLQGKFWEMHDKLYANQQAWESQSGTKRTDIFAGYAVDFGLDRAKFIADLDAQNVKDKIAYDQALGKSIKVEGTPAIFVNKKAITQYVSDGKLVDSKTSDSDTVVWGNADNFEKLVIIPALREAGVEVTTE